MNNNVTEVAKIVAPAVAAAALAIVETPVLLGVIAGGGLVLATAALFLSFSNSGSNGYRLS